MLLTSKKARIIMNPLGVYCTLGMDGFLNFLRKHSNMNASNPGSIRNNPIDFILEPQEETSYPGNPFNKGLKKVTTKDQQLLHVCRAEQEGDELSQFFERNRFIAEVYLERGTMGTMGDEDSPFRLRYEHMGLKFPREIVLPSERIIPACTIQIQTEFQKLASISLRRRGYATVCRFFQKRVNLEKVLPTDLFLSIPEMKYAKTPDK